MDNDMLPNDGSLYDWTSKPESQRIEAQKERGKVKPAIHMLEEIVARFDERIRFFSSIDAVPDDLLTVPDEFMHQIAANKVTVRNLEAEKEYLEMLIEQHR